MKGLLVKDFNILLLQKKFLRIFLIISVVMLMTAQEPSFFVAYLTMVCGIVTVSTINYDELDNGNTFLFTLPITRKGYVVEKYVLVVLISGLAWLIATTASILISVAKIENYSIVNGILEAVIIFVVCMTMEFIMIPIQIKYGGEKSRVVLVAIAGVIAVAGYLLKLLSEKMPGVVSIDVEALFRTIDSIGFAGLVAIAVGTGVVVLLISMVISGRVMERKQF